jgi:Xaa-Pro aminopeptidase
MKPDFAKRRKNLKKLMEKTGIDAIMTSNPNEVLYYTGYSGLKEDRIFMIFPLDGKPKLAVSSLENEADKLYPDVIYMKETRDFIEYLKRYKTIGYDERVINILIYQELNKLKARLEPVTAMLEAQRIVKDAYEIEQLRKAAEMSGRTLAKVSERLAGRSEKAISDALEIEYRKLGAEGAFEPIVCAGSNTQFVHHRPSAKIIKAKDMVMIDTGCRFNGYCSDITRLFFRKLDARHRKVYEDVKQIREELITEIRAGVAYKDIEALHNALFRKKGYGVTHSFGHGVGLSIHEPAGDKLKENTVITVEPGIYIKNFAGFRIEDIVLVKKGKADVLSKTIPVLA